MKHYKGQRYLRPSQHSALHHQAQTLTKGPQRHQAALAGQV